MAKQHVLRSLPLSPPACLRGMPGAGPWEAAGIPGGLAAVGLGQLGNTPRFPFYSVLWEIRDPFCPLVSAEATSLSKIPSGFKERGVEGYPVGGRGRWETRPSHWSSALGVEWGWQGVGTETRGGSGQTLPPMPCPRGLAPSAPCLPSERGLTPPTPEPRGERGAETGGEVGGSHAVTVRAGDRAELETIA